MDGLAHEIIAIQNDCISPPYALALLKQSRSLTCNFLKRGFYMCEKIVFENSALWAHFGSVHNFLTLTAFCPSHFKKHLKLEAF